MQQCGFFVLAAGGSTGFDSVLKCGSDPPDAGHLGRIVLQEGRNSISGAMLDELKKKYWRYEKNWMGRGKWGRGRTRGTRCLRGA